LKDRALSNSAKVGASLTRLKADVVFAFGAATCILLPGTWFCAFVDFPHQFWVESYPLRWVVNASMVVYVWWLWPKISETFGKNKKDREAAR
jgi:uncharacterized membrane protein YbhN (UPF0104 family)